MLLSESRHFRVTLLKKQASLTFPQKEFHTFQIWFTGIQHFFKNFCTQYIRRMHNRKAMYMFRVQTAVMDFDEILCYKKIYFVEQRSIGATTLQNAENGC